jgi:hypothetical protein
MATPFYSPKEDFDFRILEVFPAESRHEPLRCAFRIASLTGNPVPRYTALSYAWGNGDCACDIFVDGLKCGIYPNLDNCASVKYITVTSHNKP